MYGSGYSYGQLGMGDFVTRSSPTQLLSPNGLQITAVHMGEYHTAFFAGMLRGGKGSGLGVCCSLLLPRWVGPKDSQQPRWARPMGSGPFFAAASPRYATGYALPNGRGPRLQHTAVLFSGEAQAGTLQHASS